MDNLQSIVYITILPGNDGIGELIHSKKSIDHSFGLSLLSGYSPVYLVFIASYITFNSVSMVDWIFEILS